MLQYRKKYEKICGIKIPKGYEIHHIDFNRENNDINNLVMLPKGLHSTYHSFIEKQNFEFTVVKKLLGVIEKGNGINGYINDYCLKDIEQFIKIYYKCCNYIDYRDYLLGRIPNIHNIEIEKQ